ncbi:MAG TPA: hypothetical protein VKT28_19420 [Puia sp.]|nr:hypothetical protein [Puia sp.]
MIYTNDEADKSVRQKNFYLTVYLLPVAVISGICVLIHWAATAHYLSRTDTYYGYFLSLTPGLLVFAYNKKNWLKMPDGTYHNIKGIAPTNKINLNEPAAYEAVYFNSKKEKISSALVGLALIGIGIWLGAKGANSILIPIGTSAAGFFLAYVGIKGFLDKSAKLKLAKTGLWTNKLGFVDWKDITKAQVVQDTSGRAPQTILEIYLQGTVFAEANQPDERLYLTDIDGKEYVETVIDNLINNRNETTR